MFHRSNNTGGFDVLLRLTDDALDGDEMFSVGSQECTYGLYCGYNRQRRWCRLKLLQRKVCQATRNGDARASGDTEREASKIHCMINPQTMLFYNRKRSFIAASTGSGSDKDNVNGIVQVGPAGVCLS